MRNNIYILIWIFFPLTIYAQVGINTSNPIGIFNIDGKGDGATTPATIANDVVINNKGYIGAGTISPDTKLHIEVPVNTYGLAIQDGNEAEGNILSSDTYGNASWIVSDVSQFSTIPYTITTATTFTGSSYTYNPAFQITFPRFGSYSIALSCRITIIRTATTPPTVFGVISSVSFPTVNISGAVQTRAVHIVGTTYIYQLFINQNINIDASTGLTAGLLISLAGDFSATSGTISAILGDNSTFSGGTYIRVK